MGEIVRSKNPFEDEQYWQGGDGVTDRTSVSENGRVVIPTIGKRLHNPFKNEAYWKKRDHTGGKHNPFRPNKPTTIS